MYGNSWRGALAAALTTLLIGLLVTTACQRSTPQPAPKAGPIAYVGNTACEPCHPKEFSSHSHSRHGTSLHRVTDDELKELTPPVGNIGTTIYAIVRNATSFLFANTVDTKEKLPMDLVLGSGKFGMTYVTLNDDATLTELCMSYFPKEKRWRKTPGQGESLNQDLGLKHDADFSRRCLGCHASFVPETPRKLEPKFFGVGCEACHGPGAAHIAAIEKGEKDIQMERIGKWDATRLNEMCGTCHRAPMGMAGMEATMTHRFQVTGILQSPCFQQSGNTLSCVKCHNPHESTPKTWDSYEAACKSCHNPSKGKECPVNPKAQCITCHMPKRDVFPGTDVPIRMADHLIWAYGKKGSRNTAAAPASPTTK